MVTSQIASLPGRTRPGLIEATAGAGSGPTSSTGLFRGIPAPASLKPVEDGGGQAGHGKLFRGIPVPASLKPPARLRERRDHLALPGRTRPGLIEAR